MPTRIDQPIRTSSGGLHHRVLRGMWTSPGYKSRRYQRNGGNKAEDEEAPHGGGASGRAAQVSMMARATPYCSISLEC